MIWKIDWKSTDNFARNGILDMERIYNNLLILSDILKTEFGINNNFITVNLNSYRTIPFKLLLNTIENNVKEINRFAMFAPKTYDCYCYAPNYDDINRWENIGWEVEKILNVSKQNFPITGTFQCGNNRIVQKIRR